MGLVLSCFYNAGFGVSDTSPLPLYLHLFVRLQQLFFSSAVLSLLRAWPAAARAQMWWEEHPWEAAHLPSEEMQEHQETKHQPGGSLQQGGLSISDSVQHGVWLVFLALAAGRNGNSEVVWHTGAASSAIRAQVPPARSHSLRTTPLSHWDGMQLVHIHHLLQCSSVLCPETEECHLKMLFVLERHYIPHSFSNTFFSVFFKVHCGWTTTYLCAQCIWASAQIAWNSLNTMINCGISLYLFLHSCKQASVFLELIYFMNHISMRHTLI